MVKSFPELVEVEPAKPAQGEDKPACGPVYRVAYAKDGPPKEPGVDTLLDLFEHSCQRVPNNACLGQRRFDKDGKPGPFEFMTYKEAGEIVKAMSSTYQQLGIQPKDKIGVIGSNAPEWRLAMQAMDRLNVSCVPLYETLGENAIEFILDHSEARMVVAAGNKLPGLAKALPKLKGNKLDAGVIYWGDAPQDALKALESAGCTVRPWADALKMGQGKACEPIRPTADDTCTIMYTSGTTGDPKGVMISHRAVVSTIVGTRMFLKHVGDGEEIVEKDVFLSYLPLAHIFDRVVEEYMLLAGGSIGYWQGDIKKIMDDVMALKPTLFAGVPRVFERIYNGVQDQLRSGGIVKSAIYKWAFNRKLWYMKNGWKHDKASQISNTLVFNKIKAKLGGRVRIILTGGAPMSNEVEEFLKVAMCAPMVQGYGLTETCAASFIAYPFNWDQTGTVGPPLPHTELKLEEVKEVGYSPSADPPRGEVCIRSPGVFSAYYKNEELFKDSIDADGFFHTGDIGEITPSGALKIIDRKKNIFKLSQGEYIAVEKVENTYKTCPIVEQVWVYGSSLESVLVAVVVPKEKDLMQWAESNGLSGKSFKDVCASPEANKHVLGQMKSTGKQGGLKGLEDVKAVHLDTEQFSVDNDTMTPTFKLKRPQLQKRYQDQLNAMYKQLKAAGQAKQ